MKGEASANYSSVFFDADDRFCRLVCEVAAPGYGRGIELIEPRDGQRLLQQSSRSSSQEAAFFSLGIGVTVASGSPPLQGWEEVN